VFYFVISRFEFLRQYYHELMDNEHCSTGYLEAKNDSDLEDATQ